MGKCGYFIVVLISNQPVVYLHRVIARNEAIPNLQSRYRSAGGIKGEFKNNIFFIPSISIALRKNTKNQPKKHVISTIGEIFFER